MTQHLLSRLRTGWRASGLWSSESVTGQDAAEIESVEDELFFRLHAIEHAAHLRAGELPPADAHRLNLLCDTLRGVGRWCQPLKQPVTPALRTLDTVVVNPCWLATVVGVRRCAPHGAAPRQHMEADS